VSFGALDSSEEGEGNLPFCSHNDIKLNKTLGFVRPSPILAGTRYMNSFHRAPVVPIDHASILPRSIIAVPKRTLYARR